MDVYIPGEGLLCSKSLHVFMNDYEAAIKSIIYTTGFAHDIDARSLAAAEVLIDIDGDDPIKREKYKKRLDDLRRGGGAKSRLMEFLPLLPRNYVCNLSDAFMHFLISISAEAFLKQPDAIKTMSKTLTYQEAIDHSSLEALVSFLVEKEVNSLSRQSFMKMSDDLSKKLGVTHFKSQGDKEVVRLLVEVRNIIVHNRGYPNATFWSKVDREVAAKFNIEGEARVLFNLDHLIKFTTPCISSAINLDEKLCKKFKLTAKTRSEWLVDHRRNQDAPVVLENSAETPTA